MLLARLNDMWSGICCCHKGCIPMAGTIISASPNVLCNYHGVARLNDMVVGFCGHVGYIVSSSTNVICNNRGVARLSDTVASGCVNGNIITGSPNTLVD